MLRPAKKPRRKEPHKILKGWKAIGEYLGVGASEAERWERLGMPVSKVGRGIVADEDPPRRPPETPRVRCPTSPTAPTPSQ